ncbi:hypothetical protein PAUR_a4232 [Pseudoalteromonas aurantia 208]|uniref:Uncharacterized protein n=1 Tax=Pseudoalteromonas aurantia 208 TaxID=1314867 RepID=A0ABR9EH00_9GAMM|nr:hypothetical protein [Pseudoalteromonas aurantia 208]
MTNESNAESEKIALLGKFAYPELRFINWTISTKPNIRHSK